MNMNPTTNLFMSLITNLFTSLSTNPCTDQLTSLSHTRRSTSTVAMLPTTTDMVRMATLTASS